MTDIILHIGHHKTGTSTLQQNVFSRLSGIQYFHKDRTPAAAGIVNAFLQSPLIWREYGANILARLDDDAKGRPALVSSERMSAHRIFAPPEARGERRCPFLLAAHLHECQTIAKQFDRRLKVIMGIRRQDQYLASRYATHGHLSVAPGQDDFERQAKEIIDIEARYFTDGILLDYKATCDLISEAGVDVLVLPLEQLASDTDGYFAALSSFLGEPIDRSIQRRNVRSVAPDTWRLGGKKASGWLHATVRRCLRDQDREIRLTPELKDDILAAYRDSNKSLADQFGLDLARYDYC